jgi:AI-2 transport protein TqsA
MIWFLIKKVRNLADKIGFIHRYIPRWFKNLLATAFVFSVLTVVVRILIGNIESLVGKYEDYAPNIQIVAAKVNELMQIDVEEEIYNFLKEFDFTSILESFLNSLSYLIGNTMLIVLYLIFMLLEEALFSEKLKVIFSRNEKELSDYTQILRKIDKSMGRYVSLKSLIAFMNASLAFVILLTVGIDAPIFWAFIVFMFNFIPSIGPVLATVFPSLFCLIQFGEFVPFLIVFFGVGTVGVLISSLVEPRLMGNTLNISPLVTILALAIWGSIWGILGALLSVPITVAMIIILAQFPQTKNLAILLSEKGKI